MQKIINLMAITSFAVSAGIVSGGVYIYHNKENIKEQIQQEVVDSVSEMIPDLLSSSVGDIGLGSELPTSTMPSPGSFGLGF